MSLEELIHACGEDWLVDWSVPKDEVIPRLLRLLARANERLQHRFPGSEEAISVEGLSREYQKSPHKVRAFLQAVGETDSPDMLVMAWRLLQGSEVAQVELRYRLQDQFSLRVELTSPDRGTKEEYESGDIDDAAIFRHFGILKMRDRPVFDGFYALQR